MRLFSCVEMCIRDRDTEVPADTAAAEEQQVQESQDKEEHTDSENSGESTDGFFDGFTSGETVEENGSTAPVDGFEAVPEGTLDGTQEVQADNSDGVFDWKEWEQTADGLSLIHICVLSTGSQLYSQI